MNEILFVFTQGNRILGAIPFCYWKLQIVTGIFSVMQRTHKKNYSPSIKYIDFFCVSFRIMVSWRGIYFILTLFWGSFFGSIFMMGPFLPLMFISPSWYRWINNRIVATWLTLPVVSQTHNRERDRTKVAYPIDLYFVSQIQSNIMRNIFLLHKRHISFYIFIFKCQGMK